MLISSSKEDSIVTKQRERGAVELKHMVPLANELIGKTEKELAIFDTICIAFWEMARLSELTYSKKEGLIDWRYSILMEDITIYEDGNKALIKAHGFEGISGHSFHIGRKSLRAALGVTNKDICWLGHWTSDTYKIYIREYSPKQLEDCKHTLETLHQAWGDK
ncbi:hypothetical protein CROQUDRAFT_135870 [Cronartium quercuum f. sp. fusiforme G11]|uniref:Tyr recombinase domain-containing protein n=1 Tax=Cronartium quercuum f. sp. fusiforme G11 TaxID=708437 RepID=A0A9P6NDD2_9BASI|nr:hypothetical protein CROQUDRAFT_135870 [Cronartium quercuum f. sp. fusiforme G11]